jgi:hypothetical protein
VRAARPRKAARADHPRSARPRRYNGDNNQTRKEPAVTHPTPLGLADVADLIDAIDAAADGDHQTGAMLAHRLSPEQATAALALVIGLHAGALNLLTAATDIPRAEWLRRMRQQTAAVL